MRNDPNNIFAALTSRMGTLELNQSLINNWLTLWQTNIKEKFKLINETQADVKSRVKAAQAELNKNEHEVGRANEQGDGEASDVPLAARPLREHNLRMQHGLASVGDEVKALKALLNETATRETFAALRAAADTNGPSHRADGACACPSACPPF